MRFQRLFVVVTGVIALSACGSSTNAKSGATTTSAAPATSTSAAPTTTTAATTTSAASSTGAIKLATTKLGNTLTDAKGDTLYIFETDGQNKGASKCNTGCQTIWPPVIVTGTADAGATGLKVATITRTDGSKQLTINGWPAYTYAGDTKPGDANGQKVGDVWYAFGPTGSQIEN